ncbi:MAG: DUF305 domain-containing protein [Geodermatophilaceae bacterium]|nr:DUF305 domain-containing protein [Geodermatophilaceae bacterium]
MTSLKKTLIGSVLAAAVAGVGIGWGVTAAASDVDRGMSGMDGGMSGMDGGMSGMDGGMSTMDGPQGGPMGEFSDDQPFDLQFIDQMTMHHQGALMSTEMMIADSDRPELRDLAAAIETSQTAQIEQMQTWRSEWYGDLPSSAGGMDSAQMEQMMPGEAMSGMADMMGEAGEDVYLQMMIVHHQMGVDMAETAVARSERPEIRQLAQDIADDQSAQILLMRSYLADR